MPGFAGHDGWPIGILHCPLPDRPRLPKLTFRISPIKHPRLLLPCLGFMGLMLSSSGWGDECDQLPPPSVKVKRLEEPVTLNTQYGYKTLNHLGAALASPGHQILGLTRGNAVVGVEIKIPAYVDRTGRWECTSPQLVLTYGFKPLTVYVAHEFPVGSCAYNEIYNHELRHVKTYQDRVVAMEKEVAETLNRRFATGGPWRGPVGQTRDRLEQELNERWIPYVKREIDAVKAAQAQIDSPEEYARIENSCEGEIKKKIR